MDSNDWDLYAVVRGCSAAAGQDPFASFPPLLASTEETKEEGKDREIVGFADLQGTTSTSHRELDELSKLFLANPKQQLSHHEQQQQLRPLLMPKPAYPASPSSSRAACSMFPGLAAVPYQLQPQPRPALRPISQTHRSKRKKNQQKKVVCQVPADGVSTDMWAWRKYGQKPIKGSPYPRGYYRCSSSKGCLARKQVERSIADPGMLMITYTAEHNHPVPTHRNSLSGSTRQKFPPPSTAAPPAARPEEERERSTLQSSPQRVQEEEEEEEEEEEMLTVGDMEMMGEADMLFMGMEVIDGSTTTTSTTNGVNYKSPATVSVSSAFFEDDSSFEDDIFRSPKWMADQNNTAAAAGGR